MSKPELLIDQYDLKNWMSKSYTGRETVKRCTLKAGDPLADSLRRVVDGAFPDRVIGFRLLDGVKWPVAG